MVTADTLLDLHTRGHHSLRKTIAHCRGFSGEELNREIPGFGYPTIRLQLHHVIGAEEYWIGVLRGLMIVKDDAPDYPDIDTLEAWRERVAASTGAYLSTASVDELNTPRSMVTWGGNERRLLPLHVFIRTLTHIYHHQGQIVAMCRLLGRPAEASDFPLV